MTKKSENSVQDVGGQIAFVHCPVYLLPKENLDVIVDEAVEAMYAVAEAEDGDYKQEVVVNVERGCWLSISGETPF